MRDAAALLLLGVVLAAAFLVVGAVVALGPEVPRVAGYALLSLLVFPDLLDTLLRLYWRRLGSDPAASGGSPSIALPIAEFTARQKRIHLRPWALVVSVHDAEDGLDEFIQAMAPYREQLWIIDDGSTDGTRQVLQQADLRCVPSSRNQRKPGAIRELVRMLPRSVATVVVLDPDIRFRQRSPGPISDLEAVISDFQRSGLAALVPRIAIEEDGLLARFQGVEYALSLSVGRKALGDHAVTSGVSMYRRDALEATLESHSLSVYAEDLENSLRLLARGESVYYDDRLVVLTGAKRTWRGWFSQRVGWHYGLLRAYAGQLGDVRHIARRGAVAFYQFVVYTGILCLALHPLRLVLSGAAVLALANAVDGLLGADLIPEWRLTSIHCFAIPYLQSALLALLGLFVAVPRGERRPLAPVVPLYFFYSLAHTAPVTLGYANWLSLAVGGGRLYRDHYQDEGSLRAEWRSE